MIFSYVLIGLLLAQPLRGGLPDSPDWVVGNWTGSMGWEHDTLKYNLRLAITADSDSSMMMLGDSVVWYHLAPLTATDSAVRFIIQPPEQKRGAIIPQGIIDLLRTSPCPRNMLHIQCYPAEGEKLWLGEVIKIK
jgi:hypothetical protein